MIFITCHTKNIMPQLDPNSFHYQYIGIIFILVVVYTLLSYMALPSILRVLIIKKHFLNVISKINSNLILNTKLQVLIDLNSNSVNMFDNVINNVFISFFKFISILSFYKNLTQYNSSVTAKTNNNNFLVFNISDYTNYLNFLLLLESEILEISNE